MIDLVQVWSLIVALITIPSFLWQLVRMSVFKKTMSTFYIDFVLPFAMGYTMVISFLIGVGFIK